MFDFDLSDLSLGDLFALSDRIGDKYLTETEIDERAAKLQAIEVEVDDLYAHSDD